MFLGTQADFEYFNQPFVYLIATFDHLTSGNLYLEFLALVELLVFFAA